MRAARRRASARWPATAAEARGTREEFLRLPPRGEDDEAIAQLVRRGDVPIASAARERGVPAAVGEAHLVHPGGSAQGDRDRDVAGLVRRRQLVRPGVEGPSLGDDLAVAPEGGEQVDLADGRGPPREGEPCRVVDGLAQGGRRRLDGEPRRGRDVDIRLLRPAGQEQGEELRALVRVGQVERDVIPQPTGPQERGVELARRPVGRRDEDGAGVVAQAVEGGEEGHEGGPRVARVRPRGAVQAHEVDLVDVEDAALMRCSEVGEQAAHPLGRQLVAGELVHGEVADGARHVARDERLADARLSPEEHPARRRRAQGRGPLGIAQAAHQAVDLLHDVADADDPVAPHEIREAHAVRAEPAGVERRVHGTPHR